MSLPLDDGRDPSAERQDFRSGIQFERDDFRERRGTIDYWRNRPRVELEIAIRQLENENCSESLVMAQRLKQIMRELHDEQRGHTLYNVQSLEAQRGSMGTGRGQYTPLPPSDISGRITGGNYPRYPTVSDIHPGYSQMSGRTQDLLDQRHLAAQAQFRRLPQVGSRVMDRGIQQMRRYDTGLTREPYSERMRTGAGLDVDRYRAQVPQTLAQNFRDLRFRADREREVDSKFTQMASLQTWKQRQLDKKYHPKPVQQRPRQHVFGPQQPQQYIEDWKTESKKVMPFAPVMDYFSTGAEPGPSASRAQSSFGQLRQPFGTERASTDQTIANRYLTESGAYQPLQRQHRIVRRRQRWPLTGQEQRLGIDMSENVTERQLWDRQRHEASPFWAAMSDYIRAQREKQKD